jgi:RNA polymerase sigma factor (sigma-70 family)
MRVLGERQFRCGGMYPPLFVNSPKIDKRRPVHKIWVKRQPPATDVCMGIKSRLLDGHDEHIRPLLEGCLRQERESQRLLYQYFYSYGMSITLRYAGNRDEASEILNDAFMKIFTHLQTFDLSKAFKPWLRKILVNTAINHYHRKQRRMEVESVLHVGSEADTERILSGISYQEIIGMLQKLPPSYRTVFNLYAVEGYSHEEIAGMLNIAVGTSKSNLFKAKEQLKVILSDFFEADYAGTR